MKQFTEALAERMPGYALACEHEHSNSALVASERFREECGGEEPEAGWTQVVWMCQLVRTP